MTDVAIAEKMPSARRWPVIAAVIAVAFILGAAAGIYTGVFLAPATEAEANGHEDGESEAAVSAQRQEIEVGRLTVVIASDNRAGGKLHLLITPLVVGHSADGAEPAGQDQHGSADDSSAAGPIPELRDAFIEYLSQLHESEIRGSIGLVTMRAELLRRVRAVAPELNASAVLIQEFIVQ